MAKIEESYEAVCDFFARDQFLDSCSRELYVHLKPKSFKNLEEMAKRQTYSQRRPALIKHSAIIKEDRNINPIVSRLENQR